MKIAREELPDLYVCGSCEIQPEVREYWRMSTTVISAYVGPNLSRYIRHLVETLSECGFKGQLLITQSNAGVISPEVAIEQAVRTVFVRSGLRARCRGLPGWAVRHEQCYHHGYGGDEPGCLFNKRRKTMDAVRQRGWWSLPYAVAAY